jgi:DNA uptake protein ComE-like DNA-binding protein
MKNRLIAGLGVAVVLLGSHGAVCAADASKAAASTAMPAQAVKPKPLDINSAPSAALQQIAGIGEAEAARIIAGRPYNSKADLVSRKIVSDTTYAAIKDRIIVKPRATPGKSAN